MNLWNRLLGSAGGGAREFSAVGEAMATKKKAARKKSAPRKAASKRPTPKKRAPKRAAPKKRATKKPAPRKRPAKKAASRRISVKKPAAKRPGAPRQEWVVTASADRPMAEIAKELVAAGFAIEQSLGQIGVFTGRSDASAAEKARAIRGVTKVSPIPSADVGPPDSDDAW